MRWFSSAQKATQLFLNSPQHRHLHLHGGFGFHALNSMGYWSKSMKLPSYQMQSSSSFFSVHQYTTTSTIQTATESESESESSYRSMNGNEDEDKNNKKVKVDIISIETIKPAFPTPNLLRTYNLSSIDQVMFDCYSPLLLFLPYNNNSYKTTHHVMDAVAKRSKHLKDTLSQILTRFYPVAGEVKDNLHIECNDKGVYFVEARVNQTLEDFLHHPDDQKLRELIPEKFRTLRSSIGNYIAGVQVNIFDCGGIGLCTSLAHKIFDAHTYLVFMKAWAAAASGSSETISPCFVASEIFPTNHASWKYTLPSKLMTTKSLTTKRFFFDSRALALLKSQLAVCNTTRGPTRMEASTTLIWKAAAKAASTIRPFSPQSPYVLSSVVNLRKRASPSLPNGSIGNLVNQAAGICFPETQPDLPTLMGQIRESIAKVNSDLIESMKGEKGHEVLDGMMRMVNDLTVGMDEGDFLYVTSLLNSGIYEIDFGWGKPIWFYDINAGFCRIVALNDTINGGGVEATVTLSSNEMEIFERDPEILSYATVNPSPLQYIHDRIA